MKITRFTTLLVIGASVFAACAPLQTPADSPPLPATLPALKSARSTTITPSPTSPPSRPTPTPRSTPDAALFTPATPPPQTRYRLADWSPEKAEGMIAVMEAYPETVFLPSGGIDDAQRFTMSNYKYPIFALKEALFRFPSAPQVPQWRFNQAYYSAINADPSAGDQMMALILEALSTGEITLEPSELTDWFQQYAMHTDWSDLQLTTRQLDPLPGLTNSFIITISNFDIGGATYWLVETPGGYQTYQLYQRFDLDLSSEYAVDFADLTGDGIEDVLIYYQTHSGTMIGGEYFIYDLGHFPPKLLDLDRGRNFVGGDFFLERDFVRNESDYYDLSLLGFYPYPCAANFTNTIRWNGQWFELIETKVEVWESTQIQDCIGYIESSYTFFDLNDFLTFLDNSPEIQDQDESRYRLGIGHLLAGNLEKSRPYFETIVDTPETAASPWVEPAQAILEIYHSPADSYRACLQAATPCHLPLALAQTARSIPAEDYFSAIDQLKALGVPVVNSGKVDFDDQGYYGAPETWFITRAPDGSRQFWLLALSEAGIHALYIDEINTNTPAISFYKENYSRFTPQNSKAAFTIGIGELYLFYRREIDQVPYVTRLWKNEPSDHYRQPSTFSTIVDDLLSGQDPEEIVNRLLAYQNSPEHVPEYDDGLYYFLGLAYELAGNEEKAAAAYLQAWQGCCYTINWFEYPETEIVITDPYALMARLKLEPIP